MNDWFKQNSWSLIIGLLTLASSYAAYGWRIAQLEAHVVALNSQSVQTQVLLAEIQKDIEYIKLEITTWSGGHQANLTR